MKKYVLVLTVIALMGISSGTVRAEDNTQAQLQALQARVAELESQLSKDSYQQRNAELMREMVAEMDTKPFHQAAGSALTAGYDKRFFIKTADDQFKLEFDTRLQFRGSYAQSDDGEGDLMTDGTSAFTGDGVDPSSAAFELERARLYLRGHVLNDIKYNIALAQDDDSSDGTFLYTYELSHSFMPELGVKIGRVKGPFGKQETTSSGRFMMVDRSLANEIFNIDRVTGIQVFGDVDLGEVKPHYAVMLFNGLQNNNDSPFSGNDNSPGIAARLAVPMMGATLKDFDNESDLKGHENPVALAGISFAYGNDRHEDNFAGGESDNYEILGKSSADGCTDIFELGGEVVMFGADVSMKYMGLSLTLEGFYQHVDGDSGELSFENDFGSGRNAFDPFSGRAMMDGYEVDNMGWYAQAGYFVVPQQFELVSRISGVCVDGSNDSYEYAGGWNYYIAGQDLKISMDVSYIDDLPIVSPSANYDGVQNNALFLIRTQLQFQF